MKGKHSKQPPVVPDFSGLRVELKRLLEAGAQDSLVELVLGLLEKMAQENTRLALRLQAALRQAWRKKSERLSSEQLALFLSEAASQESTQGEASSGEGQPPSAPPSEEDSAPEAAAAEEKEKPASQSGQAPKRPRKKPFPDSLRREIRFIPVAQEERACGQMQKVYAVEREARQQGLGADALLQLRQTKSRPLMDELKGVIGRLHLSAVPKSALGKATTYAIKQWDTLCVFLEDARVPLSNAHVERQQRRTALGRKNYLFAGSDAGARRLAILQTFVVLCELEGVPLFEYLRDVLGKLPDWPVHHLERLLPAQWWAEQQRQHSRAQQPPVPAAA